MKINELSGYKCNTYSEVNSTSRGEPLRIPAAALWVVRPPPPDALLSSIKTNEMEQETQESRKGLNVWLTMRRVYTVTKNNYMPQSKEQDITFHNALKLTLMAGQMFGLNPVIGVLGKDNTKMRFSILSWTCFYSLMSFAGQTVIAILCIYHCTKTGLSFSSGTSIIFYGSNCITTGLFLRVAVHWPELSRHIARSEQADTCQDPKLITKCNLACAIILSLALLEHIFSVIAGLGVAKDCNPNTPLYEAYIRGAFPWVFNYVPYSNFLGVLTQFLNLQSTFNWNFTDLFVISISYYLTSRFEQINKRIFAVRGKFLSTTFWRTAREDYCRVTQLVRKVDEVISAIVFISFANNLYFICLQLFHTLEDGIKGSTPTCNDRSKGLFGGYEHAVYFVYSFIYLMSRSLAVSLVAAKVHSSSRVPASVLYDVPSPVYCVEVQRFIEQVNGDIVALSGLQFFNVTRGLVLTVAGTIVTYELVLVQFNSTPPMVPGSGTNSSTAALASNAIK